jgi:SAM-dependent methyltransferase
MKDVDVNIDIPNDRVIRFPYEHLWGWVRSDNTKGYFSIRVQGESVKFARTARPEIDPEHYIGFSVFLDLVELSHIGKLMPGNGVQLEFFMNDTLIAKAEMEFDPQFYDRFAEVRANRETKRKFIQESTKKHFETDYSVAAINALPADWKLSPRMEDRTSGVHDISAHGYGESIHQFLRELPENAFVLDAGAGLRKFPVKNVINMEIYDYPSTDILAIGQDLPFANDVFDAVLSLAVLEHVDDPFRCSSELIRVLKPGGRLFVCIPFLQAEHGYPSHYFNATRFGVQKLFSGLSLERQFLAFTNHPIFTLEQILSIYASGLPELTRTTFLNMSIGDLLSKGAISMSVAADDMVTQLNEDVAWQIAWATTTIFRKG